jgi:hypothetical protein
MNVDQQLDKTYEREGKGNVMRVKRLISKFRQWFEPGQKGCGSATLL